MYESHEFDKFFVSFFSFRRNLSVVVVGNFIY